VYPSNFARICNESKKRVASIVRNVDVSYYAVSRAHERGDFNQFLRGCLFYNYRERGAVDSEITKYITKSAFKAVFFSNSVNDDRKNYQS
jgi:hypothetical protein